MAALGAKRTLAEGPLLTRSGFEWRWFDGSVFELFRLMRTTMPPDEPGCSKGQSMSRCSPTFCRRMGLLRGMSTCLATRPPSLRWASSSSSLPLDGALAEWPLVTQCGRSGGGKTWASVTVRSRKSPLLTYANIRLGKRDACLGARYVDITPVSSAPGHATLRVRRFP